MNMKLNISLFAFSAVISRQEPTCSSKQGGAIVAGVTAVTGTAATETTSTSSNEDTFRLTPENAGFDQMVTQKTKKLNEVDYWNGSDDVASPMPVNCDDCDNLLMQADYYTKAFKIREKDQDGYYQYVYWMWSQTNADTGNSPVPARKK